MSGSAASCWAAMSSETPNAAILIRKATTYSSKLVTSFASTPSGGAGGGFTSAIAVNEGSSGGTAGTNPRARSCVASPTGRQEGPTVHVAPRVAGLHDEPARLLDRLVEPVVRRADLRDARPDRPEREHKRRHPNAAEGNSLIGKESVRFFGQLPNRLQK